MSDDELLVRDRDRAWMLVQEWIANPALRRHCRAVEIAMRAYAAEW